MRRTLLVTNDFPPRTGGIQSYLHELVRRMDAARIVVFAPRTQGDAGFDAAQPYPVVRYDGGTLLPTPRVCRAAARTVRAYGCTAVWFGAAAPLGLLAPWLRRAGAVQVVASAHGHEVGWSMLPGARAALRRIGTSADVVTYVSGYTRSRFAAAFGPRAVLEHLPPGVDHRRFAPDPLARKQVRARSGLGDRPLVLSVARLVPRKGQDVLIRALPGIRTVAPGTVLVLAGGGRDAARLRGLAARHGVGEHVTLTGPLPDTALPRWYAAADVFAMPCRTRGFGLDVEGLGLVFLEAAASGVPVIAGDAGGAPEAVLHGRTGRVVPGRDPAAVAAAAVALLGDAGAGPAGRAWMLTGWDWQQRAERLAALLDGAGPV